MRFIVKPWVQLVVGLLFVAGMFTCFAIGLWFQGRKHDLSGVPNHHYPVADGNRFYYVTRGGPPIDQRVQHPITAQQYQVWKENERAGMIWMLCSVPCLIVALGVTAADKPRRSSG